MYGQKRSFFNFFLYSESNIWQIAAVKENDIIACRNSQKTSIT